MITGPVIGSWAMGTRRLYDMLESDDRFAMHSIEHVCNPVEIARHERMVSVTQAFSIDLSGQVCTERLDGLQYGGAVDRTRLPPRRPPLRTTARRSICLSSRTPGGQPAVVIALGPDEPVALARPLVRWVVTEYGTAYLFGKSIAERALALIAIAHPDDRPDLLAAAQRARHRRAPASELRSRTAYPVEEERELTLRDGRQRAAAADPGRSTAAPCRSCSTGCPRRTCRPASSRS